MIKAEKKLSIAFYWHMHQPVYQLNADSDYLMPWVRLHAVKDYLDMLLVTEKFENLKLNFNLVPALLDALIEYGDENVHDIHSRLSVTDINKFTEDDKEFVLNNFFDAEYSSMIFPHEYYNELYQRRFSNESSNINSFSDQEYSDIMAWFNLVWIDSIFPDKIPKLKELIEKEKNVIELEKRRALTGNKIAVDTLVVVAKWLERDEQKLRDLKYINNTGIRRGEALDEYIK